jgi:hypothetical protein
MAQPTLDSLYQQHGVQRAQYLDDYLTEHGARLVPCGGCGHLLVTNWKRDPREREWMRCDACIAKQKAAWDKKIGRGDVAAGEREGA